MKKFLLVLTLGLIAFTATACGDDDDADDDDDDPVVEVNAPEFAGIDDVAVGVGSEAFDVLEGVTATDEEDGDLTSEIATSGSVNTDVAGDYEITYIVVDADGNPTVATRTITVSSDVAVYPSGTFNYKFADAELRHTFFGAAERYLLDTLDGGIPLFSNSGFVMYSSRMQLPVEQFVPVMGYSAMLGTMTEDDSNVDMDDGSPGEAGEYTYRTSLGQDPTTLLQWIYDDATSSNVITNLIDALYYFDFNEDFDGYEVKPSMASSMPVPVEPEQLPTGVEVARTWQIPLREDLMWTYHPDTDTSGFAADHELIDANDFIDTYKMALDEEWFRAISGGGDFLSNPQTILNAQEYYDGDAAWSDVGLKATDDYTIEFTFKNDINEWGVIYWLASFVTTPINMELYNSLDTENGNDYGTSPETTAYNGAFVLDYWERDKVLRMTENPNFHDPDRYFITGLTMSVIADAEIRWQEFLAENLDAGAVPTAEFEQYETDPRLLEVPGATTFRLMVNGLGTPEAQSEAFEGSDYVPEPLLAHEYFKKAMYFGIDRAALAWDVMITSTPQMYHFTDAYLVEAESGIAFRQTDQGVAVGEGLSPSTYGFNEDAAVAFFEAAVEELVEDGVYAEGDVINIDLFVFSGSESQALFGEYIEQQFEAIFIHEDLNISVDVTVDPKDFPGIYYDFMMTGEFDLSIGGISGSTLDAASFLDVYIDDNRGGFTLNWGIDTSQPEIEITYFNPILEQEVTELWSYNAVTSVLNGEAEIIDGMEASEFDEE